MKISATTSRRSLVGNRGKGERFLGGRTSSGPIIGPPSVPIIWRNLINAILAFVVRAPGRATIITDSLIVSGRVRNDDAPRVERQPGAHRCTIIGHANCRWGISRPAPPRYTVPFLPCLVSTLSFTWETMYCWGIPREFADGADSPAPAQNGG